MLSSLSATMPLKGWKGVCRSRVEEGLVTAKQLCLGQNGVETSVSETRNRQHSMPGTGWMCSCLPSRGKQGAVGDVL